LVIVTFCDDPADNTIGLAELDDGLAVNTGIDAAPAANTPTTDAPASANTAKTERSRRPLAPAVLKDPNISVSPHSPCVAPIWPIAAIPARGTAAATMTPILRALTAERLASQAASQEGKAPRRGGVATATPRPDRLRLITSQRPSGSPPPQLEAVL
jgi:hypothetical protein